MELAFGNGTSLDPGCWATGGVLPAAGRIAVTVEPSGRVVGLEQGDGFWVALVRVDGSGSELVGRISAGGRSKEVRALLP
jgi:hypothetical protein